MRPLRKTTEQFIEQANQKHNFKFDYSKTIYTGIKNKITIICKLHGEFEQLADKHLNETKGQGGCPECRYDTVRKDNEFIDRANKIHNFKYDYSKVVYKRTDKKVIIICPLHNEFLQTPNTHLTGSGCPECGKLTKIEKLKQNENSFSKSGFKSLAKDKICTFYLIKCWNETEQFYKIGITTTSTKQRFSQTREMPYNYEIIKEQFGEAESIWTIENNLKQSLTSHYMPTIRFSGSIRECYSDLNEILTALN